MIKELLKYAQTTREVKRILNEGKVLVDKKIRKDPKFPVGIMDLIEIPETKECYRLMVNEQTKFVLIPVDESRQALKPCKIIGKTTIKGGKTQLNLFDSKNLLTNDKKLQVGDTVILNVETNQITTHLKLEKNSYVYLISGKHAGTTGVITEIHEEKNMNKSRITLETKQGTMETLKEYAFVIDPKLIENGKSE